MTSDALRNALAAAPFKPFQMRLSDGNAVPVPHPEMITIAPTGRIAYVWKGKSEYTYTVDLTLVSDLEPLEIAPKKKRR